MRQWTRRFFSGLYARVLAAQFDPAQSAMEARLIRKTLGLRKGQRVLDLPCGQGRIAVALAKAGLRVTGIDLTPAYIRRARTSARQAAVKAEFLCRDMRRLDYEETFHAVVNWFTSFGYFSDPENLDVARRVYRALKPGGRFLVEAMNRTRIRADFRPRNKTRIGGVRVVEKRWWSRDGRRILTHWTFRRGRISEKHQVDLRTYSGPDIRKLLLRAGFRDVKVLDRATGKPYSRQAYRWIAVGVKPRAAQTRAH